MNFDDFNKEQQKAITHNEGAMLVLAGPGSGKTTVITYRVKHLIEQYQVSPEKILVITFTKAAATEMKQRFLNLNVAGGQKVTFGTFHSIFFRILRRAYHYQLEQIISEEEKWVFFKKLLMESDMEINDIEESVKDLMGEISLMKNELLSCKQYQPVHFTKETFSKFVNQYERYKAAKNKIDFDDMLTQCYEYLSNEEDRKYWQNCFEYILLDEYQDINQAQNACITILAEPQNNIFAVGDDDQSIYQFRGARPDFLLRFPKKYPGSKKIILPINYRSTEKIIKLSQKIISFNQHRFAKQMHGQRGEGTTTKFFIEKEPLDEAKKIASKMVELHKKGIPYKEMAVIYRTNLQGNLFEMTLAQHAIPFILKDKSFQLYSHWITRDLTAYLLFAENQQNDAAFRHIANKPKRYLSRELLESAENGPDSLFMTLLHSPMLKKYQQMHLNDLRLNLMQIKRKKPYEAIKYIRSIVGYDQYLKEYAQFRKTNLDAYIEVAEQIMQLSQDCENTTVFLQKLKEMQQLQQNSNQINHDGVTLSTMHSAKGLEFEAVFIPSIIEGVIPHKKSDTREQIEEERRLFYVAVTRAKSVLYLSKVLEKYNKETKSSCFLKEIGL